MSGVKIQKVDHVEPEARRPVVNHKRSMRTYPRGVMKGTRSKTRGGADGFVAVKDPAKPPPTRKGTLRILTKKGADMRRKTIKQTVKDMNDGTVRASLKKSNISINPKTPPHIAREILEGGMEAGMIVVK
jgi:hypothetical protein